MKGQKLKGNKIPLFALLLAQFFIGCSQSGENPGNKVEEKKTIYFSNANFVSALLEATDINITINENGSGNIEESVVNNTTSLDFSKISSMLTSIEGIEKFKSLETLNCSNQNISSLNVSQLIKLKKLYCSNSFNKSSSSRATTSTIDLSKNENLEVLECTDNGFVSLDISNNTKLKTLNCANNKILDLDLTNNVELQNLNCSNNHIDSLNIVNNVNLITLYCGNQKDTDGNEVKLSLNLTDIQKEQWKSKWNSEESNGNVSLKNEAGNNTEPETPKEEDGKEPNPNITVNIGNWENKKP